MSVDIQTGTPLAEALQNAVQNKLMELEWVSGGLDDTSLGEYIVLMLVNGRSQEEVASELKNDILGDLNIEEAQVAEFATWLFEQVRTLNGQPAPQEPLPRQQDELTPHDTSNDVMNEDADMDSANAQADSSIPTGPKSMRDDSSRDKRMLGQMNKILNRPRDQVLHRIKGAAGGVGRINSHAREPPRGPAPKGPRSTMQKLANSTPQEKMRQQMQQLGPNNPLANMTQEQQMQLFAMYEQQAKMMAQIFNPQQQQQQMANGQGPGGFSPKPGKSLFDRVGSGRQPNGGPRNGTGGDSEANGIDPASSMEVEGGSQSTPKGDVSSTMCRFNLSCTNANCHFVHQSAAAPPGTSIDMNDTCSFGVVCKNRKCTGKHPSPAKLGPLRSQQECKYFPNCTNIACPFQHPSVPPCRNGPDCKMTGCIFYHNKVECKFNPCTNAYCMFRHLDNQKRGSYRDRVWVAPSSDENGQSHVSDRKFVNDNGGEEELIKPEQGDENEVKKEFREGIKEEDTGMNVQPEGIIT